jgi:hypothetical protein
MEIAGFGYFEKDESLGWYLGKPLNLQVFGGNPCRFVLEGYDDDESHDDFRIAMNNFLLLDNSVLLKAQPEIFDYYKDMKKLCEMNGWDCLKILRPEEIWVHIQIGDDIIVSRRSYGDKLIYISIECNCDWEIEHGLQIVFKNGLYVNKVGQYDGHLTNSDAFADKSLENIIYKKVLFE